jgi:ribosomal protein S12 methylthiotransferase accessory factor
VELLLLDAAVSLPVVACLALGDGRRWPAVAVGAACRGDARSAAAHALAEAAAVGEALCRALRAGEPAPPAGALVTPLDHGLLRLRSGRSAMHFLLRGGTLALGALRGGPQDLPGVVDLLAANGLRTAVVELDAPTGWHVVRAVVPGLQPLWFGSGRQREAVPRVRSLAAGRLRRAPHPLA